jgi:hypothetical protein
VPCPVLRVHFCRSSHDGKTKIITPARALLSHLDCFFSLSFSISNLRVFCSLAPAFASYLLWLSFRHPDGLAQLRYAARERTGNPHRKSLLLDFVIDSAYYITKMPPARNQPTRTSQRRNSQQDDTPVRTRAGRGAKSSAPSRPDQPDFVTSKPSPTKLSPTTTRKTTRSASNISVRSFEAAPDVYASYEEPLFMVFGLSPEFFDGLKKHHGKLPKERKSLVSSLPQREETPDDEEDSESDEVSAEESDAEEAPVAHPAPRGRGRGGRGSRGGRGRGGRGRGRGRGGRPRGGLTRAASPMRARIARNAAPMVPLTEEDDDDSANQGSRTNRAKPFSVPNGHVPMDDTVDSDEEDDHAIVEDDSETDGEGMEHLQKASRTPESSPPPGLHESILGGTYVPPSAPEPDPGPSIKPSKNASIPKISLPTQSASQTPRDSASTPATSAVPKLLRPEDDVLSDSDLPEPWIEHVPLPIEAECEDRADYLLQTRFKPMIDVQEVIASLTRYAVSQRSTESLYALAENTQNILQQWQDQYLMLDARVRNTMLSNKLC